jgi:NAD(P)-dependent dehydrogenase (short-subunit alcohol dehydrogenase family)
MIRAGAPGVRSAAPGRGSGRLTDRVALVTGGASGIGRACALRFAEEGATVVVADLADAAETLEQVRDAGGEGACHRVDTTDADQCEALVSAIGAQYGRLDAVVAAAGIATAAGRSNVQARAATPGAGEVVQMTQADFRRVLDVNLLGVLNTARPAAAQMLRQGTGGSIVVVASTAARIPLAGAAPYCMSKACVWMLTQVLALELARTGIRVNAVGPGYTATPLIAGIESDETALGLAMAITPMHRLGRPEEVADACLFLAGDESTFVTGQMLHPAGGQFTH